MAGAEVMLEVKLISVDKSVTRNDRRFAADAGERVQRGGRVAVFCLGEPGDA